MKRFEGRVAIVSGGSKGIGAAITRRLYDEGASVVIAARSIGNLEPDLAEKVNAGGRLAFHPTDVTSSEQIEALVAATVERYGKLDLLVNNVGGGTLQSTPSLSDEQWRSVLNLDLDSVFFAARAAYPHLVATRGNIVNVASVSGLAGDYGMASYCAAKGGVLNFSRSLAVEFGKDGIRVNCVSPGVTATDQVAAAINMARHLWVERTPLGRICEPEDIAGAVIFLASDDAGMITGQNITIDGGLTAHTGQPNLLKEFGLA